MPNLDVEIVFSVEGGWNDDTAVSDILTEINNAAEAAWKGLGYCTPRGFVCEMNASDYRYIKARSAIPLGIQTFSLSRAFLSVADYCIYNSLPSSLGPGLRFVATALSL
jgi:hypothetical protein